ncbi:Cytochrome P450 [Metarhizium album ARSEF 1941]|uniref:Cytochrome P450 n=1 Tax=Metarhizium album (strain ARSEF 1941) TaxID=1081103 RepID=A0A0B2WVC8_METAS|nr:Cytochrome P450 [Metarhizium album ARSEF 1941]KHN98028.1 Cytochrome P450 [Metarhizium album ARSEF 1941]
MPELLDEVPLWIILRALFCLPLAGFLLQRWHVWWRLRHIPGPVSAIVSDVARVRWVHAKTAHLKHQNLHEQYGDVVRMGPNMGNFYLPLRPYSRAGGALPAIFTCLDEEMHSNLKKPVAQIFSLSNVVTFESLVDDVLHVVAKQFDGRFCANDEIFDLSEWLQFFAFDVMGTLTFNKRYGFLEEGKDVGGKLDAVWLFMKQAAPMMQVPWLDKILYKNRVVDSLRQTPGNSLLGFVGDTIRERQSRLKAEAKEHAELQNERRDFLDRYIEIQRRGDNIPAWAVTSWTFSNVIAGSDSVGTVMQTVMYNLLKRPYTLKKLVRELDEAGVSRPYPKWTEVSSLPYLDACVLEALRVHPPFALPFERVVPEGGVTVLGHFLPAGTIVGANPYVTNRCRKMYGEDAEFWRPERWLEADADHKRKMENVMLTFGAGRRICLGRYIGIFEIKKIVPFLVLNYEIQAIDHTTFKAENYWFLRQRGLYTQIQKRRSKSTPET